MSNNLNNKIIPYGQHYLDEKDINAVVNVLKNGWLTQGPKVEEFESHISKIVGSDYAVAVSSATAALHLACLASDLGPGKTAITSANSFVASANCIEYVGAKPLFTDIDPESLNMSTSSLKESINRNGGVNAIIPVHFSGVACDMESISLIAKENQAIVIEDASHALGGKYASGENIGSCIYSDMTIFSLHPVKGVTAGEGGVITTNNRVIYRKLMRLRSHGICKGNFDFPGISVLDNELIHTQEASEDGKLNPWYYEMQQLGFNYRITDIQCALAISQLEKLDMFVERRFEITKKYDDFFEGSSLIKKTQLHFRNISANHLYIIRVNFQKIGISRSNFMRKLKDEGVGSQVHYVPIPMHPYYTNKGFSINDYPETEKYYREALSIPIFFGLDNSSVCYVAEKISEILDYGLEE